MICLWDIENISFKQAIKQVESFSLTRKVIVYNKSNLPLKEDQLNYLLKRDWERFVVKKGFNSSDNKIQSLIENNFHYSEYLIITQDHGFSTIINSLLKQNKIVRLIIGDRASKLREKLIQSKNLNFIEC